MAPSHSDMGASSSCAPATEKALIRTGRKSTKIFVVPTGEAVPATEKALLEHELQGAAREVEIVPGIKDNVLLSTGNMVDKDYIAIYGKTECRIYDGTTTNIKASGEAALTGWRRMKTGQCRIPLKAIGVTTDRPDPLHLKRPSPKETIASVYALPSPEKTIQYLHAAAGFPTKKTWLKAIKAGNYNS
jgi:hypothetical protein